MSRPDIPRAVVWFRLTATIRVVPGFTLAETRGADPEAGGQVNA